MYKVLDGNEAVANISYKLSGIHSVYPITPSTTMGEAVYNMSINGEKNIFGAIPKIVEMQSEAGAAGTLHGALCTGALTTTYTASQGLLLMIPNMYKLAGEMLPAVFHVSARTVATHALSIYGDHSDVMAVRMTGFSMISSSSVQEAYDIALATHLSAIESSMPFLHFFDGFRTSHEINKISILDDSSIRSIVDFESVYRFKQRALSTENPSIVGTVQHSDIYFQGRERTNEVYNNIGNIVSNVFKKIHSISGRRYRLFEYYGNPNAKKIIVMIGSGASTVKETIEYSKRDDIGLIYVRLFRPFYVDEFIKKIPKEIECVTVLDRTKESGAVGDPLYQDVVSALFEANQRKLIDGLPVVLAGRYGLASKEFNPAMVLSIFNEMDSVNPKQKFVIGINDDISKNSLEYDKNLNIESSDIQKSIFIGMGSDGTVSSVKNISKILGGIDNMYVQAYFVYDSKKSGSKTTSYLRTGKKKIDSPYLSNQADILVIYDLNLLNYARNLDLCAKNCKIIFNSKLESEEINRILSKESKERLIGDNVTLYKVDANRIADMSEIHGKTGIIMQTCFLKISNAIEEFDIIEQSEQFVKKSYGKKGETIIEKNMVAIRRALKSIEQIELSMEIDSIFNYAIKLEYVNDGNIIHTIRAVANELGDDMPVSAFPLDGKYPTGTSKMRSRNISNKMPHIDNEKCTECGMCSLHCPHSVIRATEIDGEHSLFIHANNCTGCGICANVCPTNKNGGNGAICIGAKDPSKKEHNEYMEISSDRNQDVNKDKDIYKIRYLQYVDSLFEFPGSCAGCGETIYIKLLSQMFGENMIIANATGCSSIYGGDLTTSPWARNKDGYGPAWGNSLFEDNAEFGLGFRLSQEYNKKIAIGLLDNIEDERIEIDKDILLESTGLVSLSEKRQAIKNIKNTISENHELMSVIDYMIDKNIWLIGGDGWAYDIGFGGLDHIMSLEYNVNVLILDTGMYSNTGGQTSKATPYGASASFSSPFKNIFKKDIGMKFIMDKNAYVAQVAIGANPMQTINTIKEANNYNGPSLVVAYSHCMLHGIEKMNQGKGIEQQKLAVDCGIWPLYRFNPRLEKSFILDSKEPKIEFSEYAKKESRFRNLLKRSEIDKSELEEISKRIKDKFFQYKSLALS